MGFGIGINTQKTNAGNLRGKQKEIACFCWFTSKGKPTPHIIKFQNESGEIQTVNEIHVKCMDYKNFSGIPSIEYICSIAIDNIQYDVKLIYFNESCKWVINFI